MTSLSSESASLPRQFLLSSLAELEDLQKQLKIRQARKSLLQFTEYTNPLYARAGHHERIAAKLEAVERGEIDRLMIFMPPRHGKSELASKRFPAWALGRNPRRQIIAASYNSDLANDFGRSVRNIVAEPEFGQVFPSVTLAQDSQAANRFNTSSNGSYIAAGVGTAVTGRGADIGLIDDPFKDREEADSERRRDLVWDWYRSTFYTRLMPGAAVILIQTRWHEDDQAGRLLEHDAGQWEVLDLPAISDGKALWPEWYPIETLERIKATIGQREWSALYQQQPQPDEGTFFQRAWFKEWDHLPALRYYGTSDYAVTDGGGDYTVHRVWGIDAEGAIYRVDGWRGQTTADVWIERKLDLIAKYKPLAWFGESGVIKRAVDPMLQRRMRERRVFCRIYLEKGADLSEFLVFPAGKHDDDVDTASMIGLAIDQAHPAIVSVKQQKTSPGDRWAKAMDKDGEDASWKTA